MGKLGLGPDYSFHKARKERDPLKSLYHPSFCGCHIPSEKCLRHSGMGNKEVESPSVRRESGTGI